MSTRNWDMTASNILLALERKAALTWGAYKEDWPTYETRAGQIEVRLSLSGFEWWCAGKGISRPKVVELIAQRMQAWLS